MILTENETFENYKFRGGDLDHNENDPIELFKLIKNEKKPMATIVLINISKSKKNKIKKLVRECNLCCDEIKNRWGVSCAVIYNPKITLNDFYKEKEVRDKYNKLNIKLPDDLFYRKLQTFVYDIVNEFESYPVIGLCYGYPIESTIMLLENDI